MYLTRFAVNPARRQSRFLLGSPQAMHAAVLASFPPTDEAERLLWRVDRDGHTTWLYMVSPREPQLTHLAEQAGWSDSSTWASKPYAPLLDRIGEAQSWAFRLTANPVHTIKRERDGRKIRVGHVTATQQQQWLSDRSADHGFAIHTCEGEPAVTVSNRVRRSFRRGAGTVTLVTAQFDGHLRVTDPDALRRALVTGIGRAKGYGCGLLTLANPTVP
ncbi:MAG TPA: type I-E CRISPR-associated protein Cas6/Cse3/CasE [Aldersonia sp.]